MMQTDRINQKTALQYPAWIGAMDCVYRCKEFIDIIYHGKELIDFSVF